MSEQERSADYHKLYRIVVHEPDYAVVSEGESITEALDRCPPANGAERWLERWSSEKAKYVAL